MNMFLNGRFVTQPLSGVQRFATETSRALQAHNPSYALLTPQGGSRSWPGAQEVGRHQGQRWEQFELSQAVIDNGLLISLGNTGPLLRQHQIVVIHDTGVFSTPDAYSWKFRTWYKYLQSALIKRGALIVTVSEFSRREILRHLPAMPSQIHVIPEGADHMHRMHADATVLQAHGLEAGRYVLCVGTFAAHKNLSSLELLAERLQEIEIPLVIAGSSGGSAFRNARLPQLTRSTGRVSDAQLKALYEHAACFVFPSLYEGFGLPPLEAMACGCPVVAANIPVLREACGNAAEFCDPRSPEDISARVLDVVKNSRRTQELCDSGKAWSSTFTWSRAAIALDAIARSV